MSTANLLIEIGGEELPPKALKTLRDAFVAGIEKGLNQAELSYGIVTPYATPRRLGIKIEDVQIQQADKEVERIGPAIPACYDEDGKPTKALEGFVRGAGASVEETYEVPAGKVNKIAVKRTEKGQPTTSLMPTIIAQSLNDLPIPKRMRWGGKSVEFVRPVHWVVALLGNQVIEGGVLGIAFGRTTRGHRFHSDGEIEISHAKEYESKLREAKVEINFEARRARIQTEVEQAAAKLGGVVVEDDALLDEVTSLNEWPVAIAGNFEPAFLDVPQEVLIYTMADNQKYFAVVDDESKLMPHFITLANLESKDPRVVAEGNERVIRPRFGDAMFFWNQDRKQRLETQIERTKTVVFQKELGTLYEKSERVAMLAVFIADELSADKAQAKRAAQLSKCDLMTEMVGEFAALQGVMGRYYAAHDGEPENVSIALDEQYMPRGADDNTPANPIGQVLSISEKLDTLVGIFAIGQKPTGAKDPFALRRAALGVLRTMIERKLPLDLKTALTQAAKGLQDKVDAVAVTDEVFEFMLERLRSYYADQGIAAQVFDAVLSLQPTSPLDFDARIKAVTAFNALEAAESLAAADKRIRNILKKTEVTNDKVDSALFEADEEKALWAAFERTAESAQNALEAKRYTEGLTALAGLRESVDVFFDNVMVMAEDEAIKANRLAILKNLNNLFGAVADISVL